jgi:GTPase SAR1 family protein
MPLLLVTDLSACDLNGRLIYIHPYRKLVIIGDGACGKTSLLSVFTLGYFPTVSSTGFHVSTKTKTH